MADTKDAGSEDRTSKIHITVIIQNRYTFATEVVTGKQIKEKASIPAGFSLHRRVKGGNDRSTTRRWSFSPCFWSSQRSASSWLQT